MNKKLLTIAKIALHVVGWPLLFVLVLVINLNVIKGGLMYGISVFVSLIVTAVFAGVFYLAYFLVRTRKNRSIRNQHLIVAIVAVCLLSGFWMLLDIFIPDPLSTATSSTVFWEDLSDDWEGRATVQEELLRDYVTINFHLGRLTSPNGETLDDYIKQGPNKNEELKALLLADYESIDGNGYASFKGPSVDYAQSDRMTIPVLLHLFLDDRSSVQNLNSTYKKELKIKVPVFDYYEDDGSEFVLEKENVRIYQGKSHGNDFVVTDSELKYYIDVGAADVVSIKDGKWVAIHKERNTIGEMETITTPCASKEDAVQYLVDNYYIDGYFYGYYEDAVVNWHVLDMLGTAMEMSVLNENMLSFDVGGVTSGIEIGGQPLDLGLGTLADVLQMDLVPNTLTLVADMLNEPEVIGSPIYITVDVETGMLSLNPSNTARGVLGYMETAWLYNQGLLYVIVSLFSTRTLFYIYGPIMGLIAYLLGVVREAESKLPQDENEKPKKPKKQKKGAQDDEQAADEAVPETANADEVDAATAGSAAAVPVAEEV